MQIIKDSIVYRLLFAFPLLLLLAGCAQPKDGCLDINATNFDPAADNDCCCIYPLLKLNILPRADTLSLSANPVLYDSEQHPFNISNIRFYISNIRLVRSDGTEASIADTVHLYYPVGNLTDTVAVLNQFALITTDQFDYTIGTFQQSGSFVKMQCTLGIESPLNLCDATLVASGKALGVQSDVMWDSLGYYFEKIIVDRDTSSAVNAYEWVIRGQNLLQNITILFPTPIKAKAGYDTVIPLKIDYAKWFDGVNLDDPDNAISKIVSNISNSIQIQ